MRKKKVLLVDDEKIILKTLGRRLRDNGYAVTTAGNKAMALLRLKRSSYDIVITDLVLDGMGGIVVLKEAKKIYTNIVVIILTGYGDMTSAIESLRAGADDYLLKPCDLDELLLRLSRCLENQKLRGDIEEYSADLEETNKDLKAEIKKRKRVEEEKTQLTKFSSENPNPVLRIKNDGTVKFANLASEPILEAFKCTVGKCESIECLPDEWNKLIKEIYGSQESKEVELEHKGRIFAITITPFADTDFLYCYGRDITEQKQAEDELYKHRQHLQDLVQERTIELTNSNEQLKQEINVRKQTEYKLRQRRKKLQSLASELSLAEEKERRRIAVGLHDDIGQTLYISKMKLEDLKDSSSSAELDKSLTELIENIEQTIRRTRSLTFELCSPILYELGFGPALRSLTEQVNDQHGIAFEFDDDGEHKLLDNEAHVLLYQSVRELLANVAKHARANRVKVSAKREDNNFRIDVDDDGVGFDTIKINLSLNKDSGFGLFSIRERLAHLGGQLEIQSGHKSGTRVSLMVPLKNNYHV